MTDYSKTITTSASAEIAYRALTRGFEHWWTTPEGLLEKVGDRAKFGFPPGVSYWTFEATKLTPNALVEMKCVEALHKHEGQPEAIETEWLGTRVTFLIEETATGSSIRMDHIGLKQSLLCFDICTAGWDHFFGGSLKAYLDTGTGMPHRAG